MAKTLNTNLTDLPINLAALIETLARKSDLAALLQGLNETELADLSGALATLQTAVNTINTTTIPGINTTLTTLTGTTIPNINTEIGALRGQLTYRGVNDFTTDAPTGTALTNFVKLSRPNVTKGDTVINTFNNDE
jgi:hypothetical protein